MRAKATRRIPRATAVVASFLLTAAAAGCGETDTNDDPSPPDVTSTNMSGGSSAGGSSSTASGGSSAGGSSTASGGSSAGGGGSTASANSTTGGVAGGTGGAGGAGGSSSNTTIGAAGATQFDIPEDDRPVGPAWDAIPLGEPGWQDSTEPLCQAHQGGSAALDLWADERGVFALSAVGCDDSADEVCGKEGVGLQFNDGSGWRWFYTSSPEGYSSSSGTELSGIPGGPLMVAIGPTTTVLNNQGSVLSTVEAGGNVLGPVSKTGYQVYGLASLPGTLTQDRVLQLDPSKGEWVEWLTLEGHGASIWADDERIVIGGESQVYEVSPRAREVELLTDFTEVPAGIYESVWWQDYSLWLGNSTSQILHYDGSYWTVVHESEETQKPGLWGTDDAVFYHYEKEFGLLRYNEEFEMIPDDPSAEVLLEIPETEDITITRIWGRSSSEVFLSLSDRSRKEFACGEQILLWFDGTEFHRF